MFGGKSKREKTSKDICWDSCSEDTILYFILLKKLVSISEGAAQATCKNTNVVFVLIRVVICLLPKTNYVPLFPS